MREIKFRGRRVDNNEWVYGNFVKPNYIISYFDKDNLLEPEFAEIIPETVGQYTGLKDINGTEIYEGMDAINKLRKERKGKIVFTKGGFSFDDLEDETCIALFYLCYYNILEVTGE